MQYAEYLTESYLCGRLYPSPERNQFEFDSKEKYTIVCQGKVGAGGCNLGHVIAYRTAMAGALFV